MSRFSLVLMLALVASACDTHSPASQAGASSPPAMMRSEDSRSFQITETARVTTVGDMVVLEVGGQTIEVPAGEGYVISQALGRASFDALDEGVKELFPGYEPGSEKDGYPEIGDGAIEFEGIIFGPGKRPPLPPTPDWDPGFLEALLQGAAEVTTVPKGAELERSSGGWIQRR